MFSICVAMDENNLIGCENRLPWHLPEDLRRFRNVTMGKPIVMGHNTYKSIGHTLDGRINVVVSRDENLTIDDCIIINNLDDLFILRDICKESVIIGGQQIYNLLFPYVEKMYITRIYSEFKGDTYFPKFNKDFWKEIDRQDYKTKWGLKYSFITMSKRKLT